MKEQTGRTDTITLNNRCITCTNTTVYEAVQEVEQTILFVRRRQEQSTKKLMSEQWVESAQQSINLYRTLTLS